MCQFPMQKDGVEFACGRCNACIYARKMDWVSRAMAERATMPHTMSITLTYANETDWQRDGASMFRYGDVSIFLNVFAVRFSTRLAIHPPTFVFFAQVSVAIASTGSIGTSLFSLQLM